VRVLGPDDYTINRMVTITAGPFRPVASPFPPGMFGQNAEEPTQEEDTSLHGRVFRIVTFAAPWLILEPMDGIGQAPPVQRMGNYMRIPFGGKWSPTGVRLNVKEGVEVSEVGAEYVLAFKKHFCPPKRVWLDTPPGGVFDDAEGEPDCDCDECKDSGSCPREDETRKGR